MSVPQEGFVEAQAVAERQLSIQVGYTGPRFVAGLEVLTADSHLDSAIIAALALPKRSVELLGLAVQARLLLVLAVTGLRPAEETDQTGLWPAEETERRMNRRNLVRTLCWHMQMLRYDTWLRRSICLMTVDLG